MKLASATRRRSSSSASSCRVAAAVQRFVVGRDGDVEAGAFKVRFLQRVAGLQRGGGSQHAEGGVNQARKAVRAADDLDLRNFFGNGHLGEEICDACRYWRGRILVHRGGEAEEDASKKVEHRDGCCCELLLTFGRELSNRAFFSHTIW
jgi:hypothetical protein